MYEDTGFCWRATKCILPAGHAGHCKGKVPTARCGFRADASQCILAEGHDDPHRIDTPWGAMPVTIHEEIRCAYLSPTRNRCFLANGHDTFHRVYTDLGEEIEVKVPIAAPKYKKENEMPCNRTHHGHMCIKTAPHEVHETPLGVLFSDGGSDQLNPIAAASITAAKTPHLVEPNPLRDKMSRQRTEIRRLNAANARLSALAERRLLRARQVQRENTRLRADNLRLERSFATKHEENLRLREKLSGSVYFDWTNED